MMNYDRLPEHMQKGFRLYVERGVEPGGFALACLRNSLVEAFNRADEINTARMRDIAGWLYNECPSVAWGSAERVKAWMDHNGLEGLQQ